MGGAAGHLKHIHEDLNLTFGDIKLMLQSIMSADITPTEKVDGQNIFFTWCSKDNSVLTARSQSDIKNGGLAPDTYRKKWENHPAKIAFVSGYDAIVNILDTLSYEKKSDIFGTNSDRYINTEILCNDHPNVIHYDTNYIVLHNMSCIGEPNVKYDTNFEQLVGAITDNVHSVDGRDWQISGPSQFELSNMSENNICQDCITKIDNLGMSDESTIGDFVAEKLRVGIIGDINISVDKQEKLINIIIGKDNTTNLRQIQSNELEDTRKKISSIATKDRIYHTITVLTRPIEQIISDFAVEILRNTKSKFVSKHDKVVDDMRQDTAYAISKIKRSKETLTPTLFKSFERNLKKMGDVSNITSSAEGFVFEFPAGSGRNYKLTGTFSMVNQILGIARSKEIPLSEHKVQSTYKIMETFDCIFDIPKISQLWFFIQNPDVHYVT